MSEVMSTNNRLKKGDKKIYNEINDKKHLDKKNRNIIYSIERVQRENNIYI